jgi:hypothetical protein
VGSWQSQSANIGRNCLPWQPTLAARLLENGAKIEPYTIIIMGSLFYSHCDPTDSNTTTTKEKKETGDNDEQSSISKKVGPEKIVYLLKTRLKILSVITRDS